MNLSINNNQPARHLQRRAFLTPSTAMINYPQPKIYSVFKKIDGTLDAPKCFETYQQAYNKVKQLIWGYESAIDLEVIITVYNPNGKKIKEIAMYKPNRHCAIVDLLRDMQIRTRRHKIAEIEAKQFDDYPF